MLKIIDKLIDQFQEEIDGARDYAERYLESKAIGDMHRATRFKEMALDELRHASYMHEFSVKDAEELKKVMEIPSEDQDRWNRAMKRYAECMAWITRLLD